MIYEPERRKCRTSTSVLKEGFVLAQQARQIVLELLDVTTRETGTAIRALPQEVLFFRPSDRFGPAEQAAHLIQADTFNISWISLQMAGQQVELPTTFASLLTAGNERERMWKLSRLNLDGARTLAQKFRTAKDLAAAWERCRQKVRQQLEETEGSWESEVTHPLVGSFHGPAWRMCVECFCFHSYYHVGQENECLKAVKLGWKIPFIFGALGDDKSKV